jgi:hypothetical protein
MLHAAKIKEGIKTEKEKLPVTLSRRPLMRLIRNG